jgi:hypothetical protein
MLIALAGFDLHKASQNRLWETQMWFWIILIVGIFQVKSEIFLLFGQPLFLLPF